MKTQVFVLLVAAMLAVGAIVPSQFAIAQEEETKPTVEEAFEVISEIVTEEAETVVSDIIKDDPALEESIEETAAEVEADVKPEVTEAIDELETEVSDPAVEATDIIVTLDAGTTDTEVLLELAIIDNTDVAPAIVEAVVTTEVITTDESFIEAVNVIVCDVINDIVVNGTSVEVAVETLPEEIAAAAEEEITPGEVILAENNVTPEVVVEAVETGEVDVPEAVEDTVADSINEEVTPTPDPEPDSHPTPGADTIQNQLDEIKADIVDLKAGQAQTNSLLADIKTLLEQMVAQ